MSGVVDDATDDEDWDEKESDDSPMKKGAKDFIRGMMSERMDDRMDDRIEHLEQRIAAGQEFIIALRFCLEQTECVADGEELQEMIDNMETKHAEMQVKVDAHSLEELPEESQRMEAEGDREDENSEKDDEEEWFDCRTREMWSEEKRVVRRLHGQGELAPVGRQQEDGLRRGQSRMLEAASIAIAYCLESEECDADASAITSIHQKMTEKYEHHMRCAEDKRCDRGKHDRRGLMQRFSDAMFGGPGEMQDKEDRDTEVRVMADLMIPQEICEEGGEWVTVTAEAPAYGPSTQGL